MRNYWNQLACFKYFTHSKIVKCEIKHQLSSKSGKLHKITKASFLLVFISSPWKTFLPTVLSYQTPLLLPRCTSKTVKAISQCCYFLLLSFIGRRNTHTHIYMWFSNSGWPQKPYGISQHFRFFFQDISMRLFFSCKLFVWSVVFYWIPQVSIHVLGLDFIKLTKIYLSHPGLFWSSVNTHTYMLRQTQTTTSPPFSNAEIAYPWDEGVFCIWHSSSVLNIGIYP